VCGVNINSSASSSVDAPIKTNMPAATIMIPNDWWWDSLRQRDGFEAFYTANYQRVQQIAAGILRDASEAEDVAQEVFLGFSQRFPNGTDRADAWVRVAAAHRALSVLRSRDRRNKRARHELAAIRPLNPEEVVLQRESADALSRALAKLPRRAALALVLRYNGFSYDEMAQVIGVRSNQVGTLLRRAEQSLRKEIDRESHA
jgi:RNA polymerase sigma factor (sigma-70 family)